MSAGKRKLNLCFRNTAIHLHYKSGGGWSDLGNAIDMSSYQPPPLLLRLNHNVMVIFGFLFILQLVTQERIAHGERKK